MKRSITYITTNDIFLIREFKEFWEDYCLKMGVEDNRQRKNIIHKHAFLKIMKDVTTLSLADIGSVLNKDHATVLHAARGHETNYKFDVNYRWIYHNLLDQVQDFMLNIDVIPVTMMDSQKNVDSSHFKFLELSQRLRKKIAEFDEYKKSVKDDIKRIKTVDSYIKSLEARNDKLNKELIRIKNLV